MRFQNYAFLFSSKTHRSIRVHTIVLMRFRLSTLKHYKTIELHVNSMSRLQTHMRAIFSVIVFILIRFRPFLTVHTNKICMRFCFDPLSRAKLRAHCERIVDENAQRIIVDGRPKQHIEMNAFSNENTLRGPI